MRHDRPSTRSRVAAAVALLCAAGLAIAQDGEPVIIGQRDRLVFFGLDRLDGFVEAYWRYRLDETDPDSGSTTRDTESEFRESLNLNGEGYLGNPNLAQLNFDLTLRLSQIDLDSDTSGQRERTNEFLNEYDVSALILRNGDSPLTIYSRRSQTLQDRQFADPLDNTMTEHGARLAFRYEPMPNEISYFHREQEQTGRFSTTDFKLVQDTLAWQGRIRPTGGHHLWWDYTFSSIDETGVIRIPNTFDRHDGFLNHTYDFGSTDQHTLRSSFRYYQETGDFPIERFRWAESLRLRHTNNFETRYDYQFDRQERPDSTQNSNRASARFRHELYESLTTTGQIGAARLTLDEDDFTSDEWFGELGTEYRKIVPLGRILATINFDYSNLDDSERGSPFNVTDAPFTFGASDIVTITRRNIDPGSIVVTDTTGTLIYSQGSDYLVTQFGDRVEIERVLGGNIAPNQAVLIDYQIGPEPASETETVGMAYSLRYRVTEGPLRGLSPYVRYRDQNQTRTGDPLLDLPENDVQDLAFGVDYDIWRLSLSAEHQRHDSTLSPYNLTRYDGRYTQRFGRDSSLILSFYYQETDRYEDDLKSEVLNATARWNTKLTERWQSSFTGTWRQNSDTDGRDTEALELGVDLLWQYRLTTVYCNAKTAFIDSNDRDSTFQTLSVGIRRSF